MCCDTCHLAFHIECVKPPLEKIPDDDEPWSCMYCMHELRNKRTREKARKSIAHVCSKIDEARQAAKEFILERGTNAKSDVSESD